MSEAPSAPVPAGLVHLRPSDAAGALVVLFVLSITAAGGALSTVDQWYAWLAGQLLLGFALVQWFVILHECGHGTLFETRRLNVCVGWIAGLFALIPYGCWRRVHRRHHKWTGWQDLDPTTESLVPQPIGATKRVMVNACWRLWVPLFSVVYRLTNYWHLPRLIRMFDAADDRRAVVRDTLTLLVVYIALVGWIGWEVALRFGAVAMTISLVIEDLLILSQHTHIPQNISGGSDVRPFPALEQEPFTRSLRLPRAASALLLHFDAHELHHMYPFVPGYHLRRIPYTPSNEIGWWRWIRRAKQIPGHVLLFQNRLESGYDL